MSWPYHSSSSKTTIYIPKVNGKVPKFCKNSIVKAVPASRQAWVPNNTILIFPSPIEVSAPGVTVIIIDEDNQIRNIRYNKGKDNQ